MDTHPGTRTGVGIGTIRSSSAKLMFGILLLFSLSSVHVHAAKNVTQPIRIVTIEGPPFVMKDPATGKFTGLMIDVLTAAGIPIDHINTPVHDTYGWEQETGEFNGMIGDVIEKKYDLAVAPFTIRATRAKVVTFTQPVIHHGYRVLYKIPKDHELTIHLDAVATLLKPFSPGLWCVVALMWLFTAASLLVIRRYSPYEDDVNTTPQSQRGENSCGSGAMALLASLFARGTGVTPKSASGRFLTGAWWLFSLMTVGAYIASLVVILFKTNPHVEVLPFGSVEEMLSQTDVKILGVKNSATYNYMAGHHGFFERKIYQYWKHNWDTTMVGSFSEALKKLEEGDGKYAVFMDEALADHLSSQEPCDKMVIGEPVGDERVGFACQKNSTICENMNHVILTMQESGQMEKLREKYFWSGCHMTSEIFYEGNTYFDTFGAKGPNVMSPHTLTLHRFSAALIVLVIGLLLALAVLVAEILYSRRKGSIHRQLKHFSSHEDAQRIQDHDLTPDHDA